MKDNGFLAVTLSVVGWILVTVTAVQLLSGTFDTRTCQTTCVSVIFWIAVVASVIGLLLGLVTLIKGHTSYSARVSVLIGLPLCAIFAGLMIIGTFG